MAAWVDVQPEIVDAWAHAAQSTADELADCPATLGQVVGPAGAGGEGLAGVGALQELVRVAVLAAVSAQMQTAASGRKLRASAMTFTDTDAAMARDVSAATPQLDLSWL